MIKKGKDMEIKTRITLRSHKRYELLKLNVLYLYYQT